MGFQRPPNRPLSQMLHEDKTDVSYVLYNQPGTPYSCAHIQERETYRQRERESSTLRHGPKHTYTIAHLFKSLYCTLWREGTPHPALEIPVLGAEAVASTSFLLPSLIFTAVLLWVPVHTQSEALLFCSATINSPSLCEGSEQKRYI